MEPGNQNNRHTGRWITISIVAVFCVALLVYQFRAAIYNELNGLKLIPTPERFSELYFINPESLPSSTTAGKTVSFSFAISNAEGVTTTYPYSVYFQYPDGAKAIFATGTVSLADNASTTIAISHTFTASNLTGEVVVNLPSLNNQQIDFLLPDSNN